MVSGLSPAGTFSPSGLDRLWRSSRLHAASVSASAARANALFRKTEDIEHASRSGLAGQILDGVDEAERGGRVVRVELAGDDRASPAADAGDDCDILAAI